MSAFAAAYLVALGLLGLYGAHRLWLVALYLGFRGRAQVAGALPAELPVVTVQLPVYNERFVVERLLAAVGALEWPADRLEIQVLDDSTDDTSARCASAVAALRARGLDAHHLRRGHRGGFKAGALAHGLGCARGELIAIFDADFVPAPDMLARAVPAFADPRVGMVQLRWGHLNRSASLLTETQALLLDGHFVLEHGARHRAGRFFNFSGTAGVWRRAAIDEAGGWQDDTLTEDMDLSYRAQLAGWRFVFVDDETAAVPAELPADMNAFRSQQFRWAKGQMQVARKLLPAVMRAPLPLGVKLDAFFHLTSNASYALLLAVCLLALPSVGAGAPTAPLFAVGALSLAAFYGLARRGAGALGALARLPCVMALCTGLAVTQGRAIVEALAGRGSGFVRTPKRGEGSGPCYASPSGRLPLVELGMAGYCALAAGLAARAAAWPTVPFLVTFALGFAWVGVSSLWPAAEP
jgi:cellulose synthase/poly-beta-1,6-N-acetylglucosamine synthase-like glycosyltransferase